MAKLKPWYQVVTPAKTCEKASRWTPPNSPSTSIMSATAGPHGLSEPERFFERTYLTQNLLVLAAQVVRRLSGMKSRPRRSSTWPPSSAAAKRTP